MQIGCSSRQSLLFVLRKTLEGRIGVGFPSLRLGGGGVDSGYACGDGVPMWESGDGCGWCGGLDAGDGAYGAFGGLLLLIAGRVAVRAETTVALRTGLMERGSCALVMGVAHFLLIPKLVNNRICRGAMASDVRFSLDEIY